MKLGSGLRIEHVNFVDEFAERGNYKTFNYR